MSLKLAFGLIGTKRFTPILAASALGTFNDNLFKNALVVLATYHGLTVAGLPSDMVVPIAATMFTAALFFFSATAGQIADRYDRAMIMRRAKFAEIVLMVIAAIGFLLDSGPILMLTLFLMGTQSAFYSPSRIASMPHYLKPEELVSGNAIFGAVFFLLLLVGQASGQLLPAMENGRILIAGILVVFAIVGWLSILPTPPSPAGNPKLKIRWNFLFETFKAIWMATKHPTVFRPLMGMAWFYLATGGLITLIPTLVRDTLGEGADLVALLSVLFVIGAATGSLACGAFSRGKDAIIFTIIGGFGMTVFLLDVAWQLAHWETALEPVGALVFMENPDNWRLLAGFFLTALAAGMYIVPLQAMAQHRAPVDKRARLLATGNILNAGGASLGQMGLLALSIYTLPKWWAIIFVALGTCVIAAASMRYLPKSNSQS